MGEEAARPRVPGLSVGLLLETDPSLLPALPTCVPGECRRPGMGAQRPGVSLQPVLELTPISPAAVSAVSPTL